VELAKDSNVGDARTAAQPEAGRWRAQLEGIEQLFVGVPARSASPAVRDVLEQAWLEQRPMCIVYEGARGTTKRTVRIESVVMERTMTLLNCFDLDKCELRQFRLHCVRKASLAPEQGG